MRVDVIEQRLADARYARERYDLYRARVYTGVRPTSLERLRQLERACEHAEARLRHAQAGADKASA